MCVCVCGCGMGAGVRVCGGGGERKRGFVCMYYVSARSRVCILCKLRDALISACSFRMLTYAEV